MASKQHLYVALPIYGDANAYFMQSLLEALQSTSNGGKFHVSVQTRIGDSLIPRSRNALAALFLKTDCTDLLFIDSDLVFSGQHLERIMSHDADVVGGFYPKKKQGPLEWVLNTKKELPKAREDGLQPVKYIGTGFMRIRRGAFEKLIAQLGSELSYEADETKVLEHDFFRVGVHKPTNRYLSEDWYFCQMLRDCGIEIFADTHIALKHMGTATYPLLTQEPEVFGQKPVTPVAALAVDASATAGGSFIMPPEAQNDAKDIEAGCYDVPLKNPPKTVLDAGAHVGLFTRWAHQKWPTAHIRAHEAMAFNFKMLEKNLSVILSDKKGTCQFANSALSDHNHSIDIYEGFNSLTGSVNPLLASGFNAVPVGKRVSVPCEDAGNIGSFEFVKIDTEGSEIPILSRLDLSATMAVVCEAHSPADALAIGGLMSEKGFWQIHNKETLRDCRLLKFAKPEALA